MTSGLPLRIGLSLAVLSFVLILPSVALAQMQSHPLSQISPIDTDLDLNSRNITSLNYLLYSGGIFYSGSQGIPSADIATSAVTGAKIVSGVITASKMSNPLGGSLNASAYYDSDNSNYFSDLASTGTSIVTAGKILANNATTHIDIGHPTLIVRKDGTATNGEYTLALQNLNPSSGSGSRLAFVGLTGDGLNRIYAQIGSFVGTNVATQLRNSQMYFITSDGSGVLQERMRIDGSGRIGIGTSVPQAPLEVHEGALQGVASVRLNQSSGADSIWEIRSTDTLGSAGNSFGIWGGVAGSEDTRLTIESSGNVGIGTTEPGALLEVQPSADNLLHFKVLESDGGNAFGVGTTGGGHALMYMYDTDGNLNIVLNAGPGGSSYFNNKNVGIGTASPVQELEVVGDLNVTGTIYGSINTTGDVNCTECVDTADIANNAVTSAKVANGAITSSDLSNPLGGSVNATAIYDSDNSAYYLDPASSGDALIVAGNIGLGTSSSRPVTNKLDVRGNLSIGPSSGSLTSAMLAASGGCDGCGQNSEHGSHLVLRSGIGTGTGTTGDIIFEVSDNTNRGNQNPHNVREAMRIAWNSGNPWMGIGTASPESVLHVRKDVSAGDLTALLLQNDDPNGDIVDSTSANIDFKITDSNTNNPSNPQARIQAITGGTPVGEESSGILTFHTAKGTAQNTNTLNERVRIDQEGNVGIGTTQPANKLNVDGDINTTQALYSSNLTVTAFNGGESDIVNFISEVQSDTRLNFEIYSSGAWWHKPNVYFGRARGTVDSPENVVDGDALGNFRWVGYYDGGFQNAAIISSAVDGTPDADFPAKLEFRVASSTELEDVMTLWADRAAFDTNVGIGTDNPANALNVIGDINATGNLYGTLGAGSVVGSTIANGAVSATKLANPLGGSVNATAYYDSDNSNYFADLASSGTSLTTAGSVGIGTTSINHRLSVVAADNGGSNNVMRLGISNGDVPITLEQTVESSAWTFGLADGHPPNPQESFVISRGTSLQTDPMVVIQTNGNFGIDQVNPNARLQVSGGSDASLSSGTGYVVIGTVSGTNIVMDDNEIMARSNGAESVLGIQADGGDIIVHGNQAGGTQFVIEDGGDVGIGTSNPGNALHVSRSITGSSAGLLKLENTAASDNTGAQIRLVATAGDGHEYTINSAGDGNSAGAGYFQIWDETDGSSRMVIAPTTGNVGIGTDSPNGKLEVTGNLIIRNPSNNGALILSTGPGGYGADPEFVIQSAETGSGNNAPFHISRNALFRTSDDTYQYIDASGNQASKLEFENDGDLKFSSAPSGTGTVTWTDNAIIKQATGYVGINETDPQMTLDVNGGIRMSTTEGKPSCSSTIRGTFWFEQASDDLLYTCMKNSTDHYNWVLVARGS